MLSSTRAITYTLVLRISRGRQVGVQVPGKRVDSLASLNEETTG